MKIAFMGSHGVGKTTLCFDVAAHLKRLGMEVDHIIDQLLEALEVSHHRLDPQDRDGWVEAVIQAVGLPLRPPQI